MTERWLPVVGYEGCYEVSDHGRVRSVDRVTSHNHRVKGKSISTWTNNKGYPVVTLYSGGSKKHLLVHRAVALTFLGDHPGLEVCHMDGDSENPRLSNLRWDTRSGNHLDKQAHGTDHQRKKRACPRGHALILPNLVSRDYANNKRRSCRACAQEHNYKWKHGLEFSKERADIYYERIMKRGTKMDKSSQASPVG